MIEIAKCPICGHKEQKEVFKAPFFRGKTELFSIKECVSCHLWFTSPRPGDDLLGAYYEQENYVSHSDNTKSIQDTVYKMVRKRALKSKMKLVQKVTAQNSNRVLDFGAGGGAFVSTLLSNGFAASGVEPSEVARENAKNQHKISLFESVEALKKERFACITLWHVLEHLPNLHERMNAFQELLEDKGVLIVAVPNHQSWDAEKYQENWAALDVPLHLYHFKKRNIKDLASKHGFSVEEIKNMPFDSFYVSLLSEKIKNGKGNPVAAMKNGLQSNLKAGKDNASSLIYILRKN